MTTNNDKKQLKIGYFYCEDTLEELKDKVKTQGEWIGKLELMTFINMRGRSLLEDIHFEKFIEIIKICDLDVIMIDSITGEQEDNSERNEAYNNTIHKLNYLAQIMKKSIIIIQNDAPDYIKDILGNNHSKIINNINYANVSEMMKVINQNN